MEWYLLFHKKPENNEGVKRGWHFDSNAVAALGIQIYGFLNTSSKPNLILCSVSAFKS